MIRKARPMMMPSSHVVVVMSMQQLMLWSVVVAVGVVLVATMANHQPIISVEGAVVVETTITLTSTDGLSSNADTTSTRYDTVTRTVPAAVATEDGTNPHPSDMTESSKSSGTIEDKENGDGSDHAHVHVDEEGKGEHGDFVVPQLRPGEIQHVRWRDNNDIVAPNTYQVGLSSQIRDVLLDYADRTGVTHYMEQLTFRGSPLRPGKSSTVQLHYSKMQKEQQQRQRQHLRYSDNDSDNAVNDDDDDEILTWFITRPPANWNGDMHWMSPNDDKSQRTYLEALGNAGFDDILESLGRHFNFTGLVCYQVTFIAVSKCSEGHLHTDFKNTHPDKNQSNAFNVIIPLLIPSSSNSGHANKLSAGLELASRPTNPDSDIVETGYMNYRYGVAAMLGDDSDHATAPVDHEGEMRLAATIYVADVNIENYNKIPSNQAYPPIKLHPELLLEMKGRDWHPTDPTRRLPKAISLKEK
jgi:hypothetical protein